jgi:hypothetical protein
MKNEIQNLSRRRFVKNIAVEPFFFKRFDWKQIPMLQENLSKPIDSDGSALHQTFPSEQHCVAAK